MESAVVATTLGVMIWRSNSSIVVGCLRAERWYCLDPVWIYNGGRSVCAVINENKIYLVYISEP